MLELFTVIYTEGDDITPQAFWCSAEDTEHAEEQCLNAYPNCIISWVNPGHTEAIPVE
jgi:hypothetical protein